MPRLPAPQIERELYHAAPRTIRDRLAALPDDCDTVLVVGHQPGLGGLARKLSRKDASRRCARAFEHFPTAAAAVLELSIEDWRDLSFGEAEFVDFAKPRELMDA